MASGTIKGSFTGTSTANVYPEIRWSSTKNVANNTSSVKAELWFIKVSSNWYPYNLNGYSCAININGNSATATRTFDLRSAWSQKVWERTITVAHNANGAKSITISSSGGTGLNIGSVSVSGTAKLDTIPRASSIGTISGNQIGSAITIPINRASSSFTHNVSLKLGDKTVSATGVGTSAKLTPNLADFCGQLPNSTSGTAKITVDTYNGNSKIGSATRNHIIYVPDSVKPNVEYLTTWDNEKTVRDVMVVNGAYNGTQIINISKPQVACNNVTTKYSATPTSYEYMDGNGIVYPTLTSWIDFPSSPTIVGDLIYKGRVRDSRGRWSDWATVSVYTHYYVPPQIQGFSVWRDSDVQTKVYAHCKGWVSMLGGKNKGNWWVNVKNGDTWTTVGAIYITDDTIDINQTIVLEGSYDITKSYEFRVYFEDALWRNSTSISRISTAKTLIDLNKDMGVGIGKVHESNTLDVGGNVNTNGFSIINGGVQSRAIPGNASYGSYWTQYPLGVSTVYIIPSSNVGNTPLSYGMYLISTDGWDFTVQVQQSLGGGILRIAAGNKNEKNLTWHVVR